jgi:hypothetical protein
MVKKKDEKTKKIKRNMKTENNKKKPNINIKNNNKSNNDKKQTNSNSNKKKEKKEYYSSENEEEDNYDELILPGQKMATPPAGDATRAFYESLLEQRPESLMAKKYLVDYGCLDSDKAKEFLKILEKNKKKNKK